MRATEDEVKSIIDTALTAEQVRPFLETANTMVTNACAGYDHTTDELRLLEMWLAAHFVAVRDPRASEQTLGDATVKFEGQSGLNLNSTRYGQQVLILDRFGYFARLQKGPMISAEIEAMP